MRFTIRDVLWLTVLAAVVVAWQIQHRGDVVKLEEERRAAVKERETAITREQKMESERRSALIREQKMKRQLDALREN